MVLFYCRIVFKLKKFRYFENKIIYDKDQNSIRLKEIYIIFLRQYINVLFEISFVPY